MNTPTTRLCQLTEGGTEKKNKNKKDNGVMADMPVVISLLRPKQSDDDTARPFFCAYSRIPKRLLPAVISPNLDFPEATTINFLHHLNRLVKSRCNQPIQFMLMSSHASQAPQHFIGLHHSRAFRSCATADDLRLEYRCQPEQENRTWLCSRQGRHWNHSWWYNTTYPLDTRRLRASELPTNLRHNADIVLLLWECLHKGDALWTRIKGRWLLSAEFFCQVNYFECVAFLIDTKDCTVHVTYKEYNGCWKEAPDVYITTALKDTLRRCTSHICPPSLIEDCVTSLSLSSPSLINLPVPTLHQLHARQTHLRLLRFPSFAATQHQLRHRP